MYYNIYILYLFQSTGCQGDSGGSVFWRHEKSGKYFILGVNSRSKNGQYYCGSEERLHPRNRFFATSATWVMVKEVMEWIRYGFDHMIVSCLAKPSFDHPSP